MKKRAAITILMILMVYELCSPIIPVVPYIEKFSEEVLFNFIKSTGISYPEIVMAQARLESGNFKSKLFLEQNNMFGMRMPKQRETLALKAKNGYSVYESWRHSVKDYKLWQNRIIHKLKTKESYLSYIGNHYAKDVNYTRRLKQIIFKQNGKN